MSLANWWRGRLSRKVNPNNKIGTHSCIPRRLQLEHLEDRIALSAMPAGFSETQVATGITKVTSMAVAPDGRIFVSQQTGGIRVIKNDVLLTDPLITLANVATTFDHGLLGMAFDPSFESNHYLYVYYTTTLPNQHNRVSRFTVNGDTADLSSEFVLLDLTDHGTGSSHDGGAIHFGKDGKLYVASGDNFDAANPQNLNNLLGKMLRINSDGTIPEDNPFYDTLTGTNRAIWAYGLRNPFTFGIQPGTGRMFINDVGDHTIEEIDEGLAGANYGWPIAEGPSDNPAFTNPVYSYVNDALTCSIAGGSFYNPTVQQFPAEMRGDYFFADFCGKFIKRLDTATGTVTDFFTQTPFGTIDIDIEDDGSLLFLSRTGGTVWRVQYDAQGPRMVIAPESGSEPRVRVTDAATGAELYSFLAYDAAFRGGVRTTTGDVNLDGVDDIITAAGQGGGPHIRVFDGVTHERILNFFAYDSAFRGGVFVAAGDFDGDNRVDIVTSPGAGRQPTVRIFSGLDASMLGEFNAYGASFRGGVNVAVGDVNGDSDLDVITGAGKGGGPHVRAFSDPIGIPTRVADFFAYDKKFTGGVFVAAGNVDADAAAEIITGAGAGGSPQVRIFDADSTKLGEFFAFAESFNGGVRVGVVDLNRDGQVEVVAGAGPGGGPHVRIISVGTFARVSDFFALDAPFAGGLNVCGGPEATVVASSGSPESMASLLAEFEEEEELHTQNEDQYLGSGPLDVAILDEAFAELGQGSGPLAGGEPDCGCHSFLS